MLAAATDGQQWGQAAGPSYQLPDDIAERVRAGDELGSVMNEALGREGAAAALRPRSPATASTGRPPFRQRSLALSAPSSWTTTTSLGDSVPNNLGRSGLLARFALFDGLQQGDI
jgi:hypothetical protein